MFYLHPSFYSSEMGQIYSFKYFLWKKRTIIENKWTCCSFKCYEQISHELPVRISDQHSLFCLLSLWAQQRVIFPWNPFIYFENLNYFMCSWKNMHFHTSSVKLPPLQVPITQSKKIGMHLIHLITSWFKATQLTLVIISLFIHFGN